MDPQMNSTSPSTSSAPRVNLYEVRPCPGGYGFDLLSGALSSGRLTFSKEHVAVGYATLHSGARASVIRIYDAAGNLLDSREQQIARER